MPCKQAVGELMVFSTNSALDELIQMDKKEDLQLPLRFEIVHIGSNLRR